MNCAILVFFPLLTDNLFMFTPNNINCLVTFNVYAILYITLKIFFLFRIFSIFLQSGLTRKLAKLSV